MPKKAVAVPEPDPTTIEPDGAPDAVSDPCAVKLVPNLDLTTATDLASSLMAARGNTLTIDASEVQHLGAQCAQILVSAKMTWEADGQPLRIAGGSAEFIEGARLLGLQSALQDEDARS